MTKIKSQLSAISDTIKEAVKQARNPSNSIRLLAVSKTKPAALIRSLFEAGQHCFGENYLQEALAKITTLSDLNIEWHFIGPIQSNKTKDIATHFDWVQSVDRLKIAQRLSNQRPANLNKLNVCIQVNIDDEVSKSGIASNETIAFAHQLALFENIKLRGLMIIPTKTNDTELQRQSFIRAYKLFTELSAIYPSVDTLSMGMSADMAIAISEGSTMIRIGTALFGQRDSVQKE